MEQSRLLLFMATGAKCKYEHLHSAFETLHLLLFYLFGKLTALFLIDINIQIKYRRMSAISSQ